MRVPPLLALAALVLAGCAQPSEPPGASTIELQMANHGQTTLDVPVSVTGPNGTRVLSDTLTVPGGGKVVQVRIQAREPGAYTLSADYDHERVDGTRVQRVSDGASHVVRTSDCQTPVVAVLFSFANTQEGGTQRWSNQGTRGFCLES